MQIDTWSHKVIQDHERAPRAKRSKKVTKFHIFQNSAMCCVEIYETFIAVQCQEMRHEKPQMST